MNEFLGNVMRFVAKRFDTLETIFVVLFSVGMALLMTETIEIKGFKIAEWTLWISLGGLILVYWIMSYHKTEKDMAMLNIFVNKLTWLGYAVAVLGILLKVQFEEKAEYALLAGLLAIALSIGLNIYLIIKKELKSKRNIVRGAIIGIIALFLYTM